MRRTTREAAQRFAREALGFDSEEANKRVADFMIAFHQFEKEQEKQPDPLLMRTLKEIANPIEDIPRVVEKLAQAHRMLREEDPSEETSFLARSLLKEALTLLGRKDLTA